MNENYINNLRELLYNKKKKTSNSIENEKKSRKVKFAFENYKSENVFSLLNTTNKSTAKNKRLQSPVSASDDVFEDKSRFLEERERRQKKIENHNKPKNYLSPSISETSYVTTKQKKNRFKKINTTIVDKKDVDEEFDLNSFFSTREQSFNESFIEPHSGIDYEFLGNSFSNVQISSSRIYEHCNSLKESNNGRDGDCDSKKVAFQVTSENGIRKVSKKRNRVQDCSSVEQPNEGDDSFRAAPSTISTDVSFATSEANESSSILTKSSTLSIDTLSTNLFVSTDKAATENAVTFNGEPEVQAYIGLKEIQTKWKSFDLKHFKLVILKQGCSLPCYGLGVLKVLHGKLQILGYTLDKRSKEVKIYSPRGSSLLVLKNTTCDDEIDDFEEIQPILNSEDSLKDLIIEKTSTIFVCSKLDDCKISFLEKYISQQIFPKVDNSRLPQIIFNPEDKFNIIKTNNEWENILKYITHKTMMLITGGKGVGKSTFVRYSINSLLNRFTKVRVIDLDPGQSEFSIPGCLSVVTISEPILGPNYTHLKKTDRSFLSNINVGYEPQKYLQCIKILMKSLNLTEEMPTLINYMGYSHGIGINIVSSAITFIQPTDVVQIDSKSRKKNFLYDITPKTVRQYCNLLGGVCSSTLNFRLIKLFAMSDGNYGWSLEPRQVREMCVLTYFGEIMKDSSYSFTSSNLPIYQISLNSITLRNDKDEPIPPAAVNSNLVALCSNIIDKKSFNVKGYGIVRGVDLKTQTLVLITPEPIEVLEEVFYLVLGSVYLPPSVYMTTDNISGSIPYVMEGELESLGQITRRSYIPVNKK